MFFARASTSRDSEAYNEDTPSTEWLTKEEFDALYPNGYRDSHFIAEQVKTEVMHHEKEDSHLKLTSWFELQRYLQETGIIGHSVDTYILTQLLQYNSTGGLDIQLATENPDPVTQDALKPCVATTTPLKLKQNKKKWMKTLKKSPNKNCDIRALFSSASKSNIKNYTNLINNLDIDGNLPTRIINLLVDISVEQANIAKQCYVCQYCLLNCSILQRNENEKTKNNKSLDMIDKTPYLPNIDLINNFTADMLLQHVNITLDNELSSSNDNIPNQKVEMENEISKNFDLQLEFHSLNESLTKGDSVNDHDNVVRIEQLDIVHDNSDIERESDDSSKTLEYFGLHSIDDLFGESDEEASYQSDSTIIYSFDNSFTNNANVVITDSDSDLESLTEKYNKIKLLRNRNNESKYGSANKPKNVARHTVDGTITSLHNQMTNEVLVVETNTTSIVIDDSDSDSNLENHTHKYYQDKLLNNRNKEADSKVSDNETAGKLKTKNTVNSPNNNPTTNKNLIDETNIIALDDSDSDFEAHPDKYKQVKLLNNPNNNSDYKGKDYESAKKPKTKYAGKYISTNTVKLPYNNTTINKNQVVERSSTSFCLDDSDSDFEAPIDKYHEIKLLRKRNNEDEYEGAPYESANMSKTNNVPIHTLSSTINSSLIYKEVVKTNTIGNVTDGSDNHLENHAFMFKEERLILGDCNYAPDDKGSDNKLEKKVIDSICTINCDSNSDTSEEEIQYSRF